MASDKYARKIKRIENSKRYKRLIASTLPKSASNQILENECPFCEYSFQCIYETRNPLNGQHYRLCLVRSTAGRDVWLDVGPNPRPEVKLGDVYGKLTVEEYGGYDSGGHPLWVCRCECGNTKRVVGYNLVRGFTTSCGCGQGSRNDLTSTRIQNILVEKAKKWHYVVGSVTNPDGTRHHYPTEHSSRYRQSAYVLVTLRDESDPYDPEKNLSFYEPQRCTECGELVQYDEYNEAVCIRCGLVFSH